MTHTSDTTKLDTCGCCGSGLTQVEHFNRPGKPAIDFRIGTHSSFLRRMLARIPTQSIPDGPNEGDQPLAKLTTRSGDDAAIAFLDAWAVVCDVLTFYQERIANEGYLRTALERRSVLELARSIGYELNPGVAAGTSLAFSLDEAPGAPEQITIDKGIKVLSVPGQNEKAQTFETVEQVEANVAWNSMKPRQTVSQEIKLGLKALYLEGIDTQLQKGDALLLVGDHREKFGGSERWDFRILKSVTAYPEEGYTYVTWEEGLGHKKPPVQPADNPKVYAFRQRAALFGHNAPDWRAMPVNVKQAYKSGVKEDDPSTWGTNWPDFEIKTVSRNMIDLDAQYPKVLVGSWVALVKPSYIELYKALEVDFDSRTDYSLTSKVTRLKLDSREHLSWFELRDTVVFAQSEALELAEKPMTAPICREQITLNSAVLGLEAGRSLIVSGKRARVKVGSSAKGLALKSTDGAQTAALKPGDKPWLMKPPSTDARGRVTWQLMDRDEFDGSLVIAPLDFQVTKVVGVGANEVVSEIKLLEAGLLVSSDESRCYPLEEGELLEVLEAPTVDTEGRVQWQIRKEIEEKKVTGYVEIEPAHLTVIPAEEDDDLVSELVAIKKVEEGQQHTTITLSSEMKNCYDRETAKVYGNVADSTHGETINEVLGSGVGSKANQSFTLKKPPLTYVSSPTPSGAKSTLELRVNDVLWEQKTSLYGLTLRDQNYIVRIDDDDNVRVTFGNGIQGTRLPSGTENIKAIYRSGIGLEGEVSANSLTVLQTRPLGVREVTNPLPASGAAAPETRDKARANAPLTVLTLDRIVSVQDYEDFARSYAGIGKAKAAVLWDGENRLVHISIASASGKEVTSSSNLYKNLGAAIEKARDPSMQVRIASFQLLYFNLVAKVMVDARYLPEEVKEDVEEALETAFAFEKRSLGQPVTAAEVIKTIQAVAGVVAVDLDQLYLTTDPSGASQVMPEDFLPAHSARWQADQIKPAELLLLKQATVKTELVS